MTITLHRGRARRAAAPGVRPLADCVGAGLRVPVLGGAWAPYVNLDCAATAPALVAVTDAVTRLLPHYASVHRGAGLPSRTCTAAYEAARRTVHAFVGSRDGDVAVFTRNTTDALNLVATAVPRGAGDVLFLDLEHHANLLPWQALPHRCIPVAATVTETLERLAAALAAAPAALVAITGASNVTGEVTPVRDIAALARTAGARVVVDAAQLAPHRRIDLAELGADYVALSGHKLYAPFGAGALVGRRDWLDAAPPYQLGGGAVREVTIAETRWADAPARHEGGTPNLVGAVALAEACRVLAGLPGGALEAHEHALLTRLRDGLAAIGGVRVHRVWSDHDDVVGVASFAVEGHDPGELGACLSAEHAIGVRSGRFCAHPLLSRLGAPEGALRVSFGLGTTLADVDRLLAALERVLRDGPRHAYRRDGVAWVPVEDDRPSPDL
ncbi:MAG: aminotransferase class V-fold PLP-dependent enzyme [Thermoleophilia bacterium]